MIYLRSFSRLKHLTWAVGICALLLSGCKPGYPKSMPTLHTTISADGQMVATLINAGTDKQRLRIMRLDSTEGWRDIAAPQYPCHRTDGL